MNLEMTVVPGTPTTSAVEGIKSTQAPAKEEAAPAQPPTPPSDYSERAAALVRKEKNAYREKQEAKAIRAQIDQKRAELEAKERRIQEFESIKQTNPLKALEMLGLDYDALTQVYLNNGQVTPEVQVKNVMGEIEQLKKQQLEREQKQLEEAKIQAEAEANEVLTQFKSEIQEYLGSQSDSYEFINLFAQQNLVYDTIQEYFDKHKSILSIKEASDLVENYLEDQVKKSTATNKFKKLLGPQDGPTNKTQQQTTTQQPRTLSNNMTSSAASFLPAKTEQDRINRALAALDKK